MLEARGILLTACAAVTLAVAACRPAAEAGGLSDRDVAAIKELEARWVQIVLGGDWAAGAAVHTEDAVRMPPNASDVRGREAIEASLAELGNVTDFTLTSVEIDGRDNLAYAWETGSITFIPKGESEAVTDRFRALVTFRKQPDGSWLADRVIWNSDQPPPN